MGPAYLCRDLIDVFIDEKINSFNDILGLDFNPVTGNLWVPGMVVILVMK